ncbi:MAG: HEAT repeat domain-containing protein [Planctomycetota bacterium]
MRNVLIPLALVLGAVGGYLLKSGSNPETDRVGVDESRLAGIERDLETLRAERDELKTALARARGERDSLSAELLAATRADKTAEPVAPDPEPEATDEASVLAKERAERKARISAALKKLRENPMSGLMGGADQQKLAEDIRALGEEGLAEVLALLASDDPADRSAAAMVLMGLDDPATVGPLSQAIMDESDPQTAAMLSQALIRMNSEGAVPALRDAVANSPHEGVKVNSLWGLCRHGDANGVAQALAYYQDDEKVGELRDALGRGALILDTPAAMPLIDAVRKKDAKIPQVMNMVVAYYARIPGQAATDRLAAMANDQDLAESVRQAARTALDKR